MLGQLVTLFSTFAIMVGIFILIKYKKPNFETKFLKISSLVLAVVFFFRFMLGYDAIRNVVGLAQNSPLANEFQTATSLLLNWFIYTFVLLAILYPFFAKNKYAFVLKYFGFFVALLSTVFISLITKGIEGAAVYNSFSVRGLLIGFEIGMLLAYSVVLFIKQGFAVKKSDLWGLAYLLGMLLATMPPYFLQGMFGFVDYTIKIKSFTLPHRIILYFSILIPIALYVLLRKKDSETVRGALLYIALGTLVSFSVNFKFITFTQVTNWPLHLCNTAMYLIPLCLIFNKWDKLFYFTYFINVLGAFLAMAMPNYSDGHNLFDNRILEFFINHYIAFFMPVLMVFLKVYARPKLKQFYYSMVGFGIYFFAMLVVNSWFSNYGSVDYFFLNSDFIADKLGAWARNLRNITWTFEIKNLHFTFYPVYQILFFLVYIVLGAGVWFLYEGMFSFVDTTEDILQRKRKIAVDQLALEAAIGSKNKELPINMEGTNKVIIKDFSKRYGKSSTYAVKDANLEIIGGEIFGFLGHNGAGKSTIIKSIVGIQPITSGTIEVCGFDVDRQPVMAKKNIGFVPDHYALYEKLTGREYVNYIADLYDVSAADREASIEKYVALFELTDAFDSPIKTYSHGMKQKVTIMSALVHNPKVWILDEPLTGLDPNSIFQVKQTMKQHAKEGNIVFFSSHLIDVVKQVCDKIAIIKNGNILTTRYVADIEKEMSLEEFYLTITSKKVAAHKVESESQVKKTKTKKRPVEKLAKNKHKV